MATYAWKGVQDGKYAAGRMEGINRDEAAFKVKQQKVIITSLTRLSGVEQKGDDEKEKQSIFNFFPWQKKESTRQRAGSFHQEARDNDAGRFTSPRHDEPNYRPG